MRRTTCEQCDTHGTCIIRDLPAERLDEFRASGIVGLYKRRQVVFHEDAPADGLYVLCRGTVKLYQSDRFGRDHIVGIAEPGDVLGELALDRPDRYSVSGEALTEAQICYLPRERIVDLVERHPMVGVRLIAALSSALAAARRKVRELALKRAEGRLAELLLQLIEGGSAPAIKGTRIALGYSRRELAEMIGVSTETAIRLLGKLKQKHVIATDHRDVIVTDPVRLARIASHNNGA